MQATDTTPRVWIADLAAYNEGHLHGEWVDATDADAMREAGERIIKSSPALYAEELIVHDYDNFPRSVISHYGETGDWDSLALVGAFLEEHGEAGEAYLEFLDGLGSGISFAEKLDDWSEHYAGEWDNAEEFAQDTVAQIGWGGCKQIPEELWGYLNWDAITRDMVQHGDVTEVRLGGSSFMFRDDV